MTLKIRPQTCTTRQRGPAWSTVADILTWPVLPRHFPAVVYFAKARHTYWMVLAATPSKAVTSGSGFVSFTSVNCTTEGSKRDSAAALPGMQSHERGTCFKVEWTLPFPVCWLMRTYCMSEWLLWHTKPIVGSQKPVWHTDQISRSTANAIVFLLYNPQTDILCKQSYAFPCFTGT